MKPWLDNVSRCLRAHPTEPVPLRRLVNVGVALVILGFLAAILVGVRQDLWDFETYMEEMESQTLCCSAQHDRRRERLQERLGTLDSSTQRLDLLEGALLNPASPHFALAREKLAEEQEYNRILTARIERLEVEPLTRDFVVTATLVTLVVLLAAFAAARLMIQHASDPNLPRIKIVRSDCPYWTFVAILFLTFLAREIWTSVVVVEKSWFGWNSFCVSNAAWVLTQVMFLGFAMVIAYPSSVLWHLSRAAHRPPKLCRKHTDGAWGVKKYVLFLQTWAILALVFFFAPTLLALRIYAASPDVSFLYTAPSIVYSAVAAVVVCRLIMNAVMIRKEYINEVCRLGKTWQEIQLKKPPADPTINFLGAHWWKLPATILGATGLLWAAIEWSGVLGRFQ